MIETQIHWLAITIHDKAEQAEKIYDLFFRNQFGDLNDLEHGGRGYKTILKAALELKIYLDPITFGQTHFHIEIPGTACESITLNTYQHLMDYLISLYPGRFNVCRFDFAFDRVPFEPRQVYQAVKDGKVRSLAKRESLKITESPFAKRNDGEIGTITVEFGMNTSNQMITVYNRRGFTRLEFQTKNERATVVALDILRSVDIDKSNQIAIRHLLDFVDFKTSWWQDFINGETRSRTIVTKPREVEISKTSRWLIKQVAPALSAVNDAVSPQFKDALIIEGRRRRGNKYSTFFQINREKYSENNASRDEV